MTGEEARKRLLAIKPDDDVAVDALAAEIERDCRALLLGLARLAGGGQAGAETAGAVLETLEELAVRAFLDTGGPPRARETGRRAAVACHAFGSRMTTELSKYLDNPSRIPVPTSARPVEDPEPPRRVCDEAYLLLRRWQKSEESRLVRELTRREFLRLEMPERDREIDRYRKTKRFTAFVEDVAE